MRVYPSGNFESAYQSRLPVVTASIIAMAFGVVLSAFFLYSLMVWKRHRLLIESSARTNVVLTSLFPTQIRDRVMGNQNRQPASTRRVLKNVLTQREFSNDMDDEPMADLFLDTTVLCKFHARHCHRQSNTFNEVADIVGFTAWSSVREPSQVFMLLETLYRSFDAIARRRNVFKVETVGDCYVAVTGLPEPRKDQ